MAAEIHPIDTKLRARREAVLLALMAAQNRSDIPGVIDTSSTRASSWSAPAVSTTAPTRSGAICARSRIAFPDQHYDLIATHHAEEAVICEVWMSGTHRGAIHGFEPTGKSFRTRIASFFLFEGTDLVCQRIYYDARGIVRQLA